MLRGHGIIRGYKSTALRKAAKALLEIPILTPLTMYDITMEDIKSQIDYIAHNIELVAFCFQKLKRDFMPVMKVYVSPGMSGIYVSVLKDPDALFWYKIHWLTIAACGAYVGYGVQIPLASLPDSIIHIKLKID